MIDLLTTLPSRFRTVRYDSARIPDGSHDLSSGANCQRYAYAVPACCGVEIPLWRSSELWTDRSRTRVVSDFEFLNLLLFAQENNAYGAHVAVYAGAGRALHLCKVEGHPVVWPMREFLSRANYRVLIGGKRVVPLSAMG